MASIADGFTYDIFISYRQNDNKYDGWVSEFVVNLKKELEATVKDKINIYFDENPYDGVLETHNVDKSLTDKLKSIIFLPILSQTYCDIGSYAWQHEFLTFNRMIREDKLSSDVKLRNGNTAGRILPVRIHNLDSDDLNMLQSELGGQVRAIDFIYREPGVNRPLRPEDNEEKNLNRTRYRNQLNKVANSIKEILISIQSPGKLILQPSKADQSVVSSDPKSIAVLPFVNMSNDPEQEYFSDGISEEIINTLVQVPGLKVAGRTSAFSFKNRNEDLRVVGEKLNVNTILEGSVRKSGNRIRITAQLIEASTGYHLWSQKYDRELNDVFVIQDEIAKAIVEQLQVTLEGKPAVPKERLQTQNVEAYQQYLKGMAFFYKRGVDMFEGIRCFEEALKIDPDYPLALAGMADSHTMLCLHSYLRPEDAWPKAAATANRAIQLGPDLAEVHSATGIIALLFERNWEKAEKEFLTALRLNPGYLQARCWYALFYLVVVRHDLEEALRQARLAVENDPLSSYAHGILSLVALAADLGEESLAAAERSVGFDQEAFVSWYSLGISYHYSGFLENAIQAYQKAIDVSGRHNWALTNLLTILLEPSEFQQVMAANSIYRELLTKEKTGFVNPFLLAVASAALGKNEDAIRYTKQAIDRHDPVFSVVFAQRPESKAFRAIPQVIEMLKSIGLY
jgi:TolB-like protein/Flp pilus assembly protein TadD